MLRLPGPWCWPSCRWRRIPSPSATATPPTTRPPAELAEPAGFDAFTSREREILIEVAAGLSNAEMAAKLFLAEVTVKTHVGRMLNKLRLRDRVQAVVYAYEHGLVRPGSRP